MEKQQYILKLSLKQIALRKVIINLCNEPDILPLLKEVLPRSIDFGNWTEHGKQLITKIKEKVSSCLLPNLLEEELGYIIDGIISEISNWQMNNCLLTSDSINAIDHVCWTSHGTVDYRETAKRIIKQKRGDINSHYMLACYNCLEEEIRIIWDTLSDQSKKSFRIKNCFSRYEVDIVHFWTYYLDGNTDFLEQRIHTDNEPECTLFQYWFERAAVDGDKVVAEYFFQKLTSQEREASLVKTALTIVSRSAFSTTWSPKNFSAILIYLLSQMNEEEQIQVFKRNPVITLCQFLNWPWAEIFMKVARFTWSFLSIDDYRIILTHIGRERCNYAFNSLKLFAGFFFQAPSHYRTIILNEPSQCVSLITDVVDVKNAECVKFVIRNLDKEVKEIILTENSLIRMFCILIVRNNWSLLELVIEELTLSSEAKRQLSKSFESFIIRQHWERRYDSADIMRFFHIIELANRRK